ncbi:MAG: conserved exported protein of unknown function [Nitrospira sp.]|nr:MAG: conserved exported protein of unknown function [Nitrospira sp.]
MCKPHVFAGPILVAAMIAAACSGGLSVGLGQAQSAEPTLQEQSDAMMKNIEDMMGHGGMGDAKAIVHHCEAAAGYAEAILKQLPASDPRRSQALAPLTDIVHQCQRVAAIGSHADPGQLLNPASKAKAAARASVKALGLALPN